MSASMNRSDFVFVRPPEAPVFEPTPEEFRDPFIYLAKIRPLAEEYGICKIRPPPNWQPPFAVDIDTFTFTPRLQRINELEAKTRVKLHFLDHLTKFWELQGVQLKIPMVEKRFLDLYTLRKAVEEEGGFEAMAKDGKWTKVATRLGYQQGKHVASSLRQHYEKILYPYDIFLAGASSSSSAEESDDVVLVKVESKVPATNEFIKNEGAVLNANETYVVVEVEGEKDQACKPSEEQANLLKEEPTLDLDCKTEVNLYDKESKKSVCSELKKLQFLGAGPKMALPDVDSIIDKGFQDSSSSKYPRRKTRDKQKISCSIGLQCRTCGADGDYQELLVCDECADAYHYFCLNPPLQEIPQGTWRCHKCIARVCQKHSSMVYGFEQGSREYTLQTFGEMADKFKEDYFGVPVHTVSCAEAEKEFWRLVNTFDENVVVEYGADNPAGEVGSGFPTERTKDQFPDDEDYIHSPWNLNNIASLPDSLLHFISADISGMKVPWCYVGMVFSCFAWHTEDHWTSSINYLHWGEPKTWYGVPSSKAELLEAVMKQNAPELFEQSPDLLHQLTTIMNPNTLMSAGVPVCRTDQYAGDMIVTFPRGYHAGFNQGYNFAEAVNFSFAEWLPMGRQCIEHYRVLKRQCVFSHDELVCKMASLPTGSLSSSQTQVAYRDMIEMVNEEKRLRKSLLLKGTVNADREAFELLPDDERQCEVCKTTCFLSAVTCDCNEGKLVCINHADELCSCPASKHCLRYRYTLNELLNLVTRLKNSIDQCEKWSMRARAVCDGSKKHDLSTIQELLTEARDYRCTDTALFRTLENAVQLSKLCDDVVHRICLHNKRNQDEMSNSLPKLPLTADLREDIEAACCVIKDEQVILKFLLDVDRFHAQVRKTVKAEQLEVSRVQELLDSKLLLYFDLPEKADLDIAQKQVQWLEDVRCFLGNNESPDTEDRLQSLEQLITAGTQLAGHPSCERSLTDLQQLRLACQGLEQKANAYLQSRPPATIDSLQALIKESQSLPIRLPSLSKLEQVIHQATEWSAEVDTSLTNDQLPWLETLNSLVIRGHKIPVNLTKLPQLEAKQSAAREWIMQTSKVFLTRNSTAPLLEVLSPRTDIFAYDVSERAISMNNTQESLARIRKESARELKAMLSVRLAKAKITTMAQLDDSECICKQAAVGSLVQCQLCYNVFHARCVSFTKAGRGAPSAKSVISKVMVVASYSESSFFCPRCCRSRRPALNQVLTLLVTLKELGLQLPEGIALQSLTNRTIQWLERARSALSKDEIADFITRRRSNGYLKSDRGSQIAAVNYIAESTSLSIPQQMISTLDALLVEGDLLEINVGEKESLRAVLRNCRPDTYCLFVFVPLKFSNKESSTNAAKWKHSLEGEGNMMKTELPSTLCDSGIVGDIISISDDDDVVAGDDHIVGSTEACASRKCCKPSGKNTSMLICDVCNRCYHVSCASLDGVNNKSPGYVYTCYDCIDRAHCHSVPRGTHESSEIDSLRQTNNSCIKRKVVVDELSETNLSGVDQKLDRIESVNTRLSDQGTLQVDNDDDDVIVLD